MSSTAKCYAGNVIQEKEANNNIINSLSMKKQIILTMLSLSALNVAAQDIIVMKNGDEVEAKVTKVGTTEVEYHKWSNQDGPVYSVAKSDVFMVKYKNGEKDVLTKPQQKATMPQSLNLFHPHQNMQKPFLLLTIRN